MNRTATAALLAASLCGSVAHAQSSADKPAVKDAAKSKAAQNGTAEPEAKTLAELFPEQTKPKLWLGSKAPELKIAEWVRGDSVAGFEKGRTYVVEFWATWCGPCIAAFPHLAELQKEHADNVTVIGVNIWERQEGAERSKLVRDFVTEHDEMQYTVALEEGTAMADTWMKPANRNGIPSAFIVGPDGNIAWMGHPMQMDEPLKQIVAGEYDVKKAEAEMMAEQRMRSAIQGFQTSVAEQDWDRAYDVGRALMNESFSEEPRGLNAIAWMIVSAEDAPEKNLKLAHKAAKKAAEMTEWNDWQILDTYAMASFRMGQTDEAIKWQTKAIELAPAEAKGPMGEQLKTFGGEG
jgi:thiol-disulfide isomerase/thioredoxin